MKHLLILLLLCMTLNGMAFQKPIVGTVLDTTTNAPLPFTNIAVKGKTIGTVSNGEGRFVLDPNALGPADTILFSYVGYKTLGIAAPDLPNTKAVYLHPATVNLQAVEVYSKQLTAEDIVRLVRKNYSTNHPAFDGKQELFFHKFERTPWPEENQINLKKTNFTGLDEQTFNELFAKLPREFTEYQDALLELHSHDENHKLVPVKAISLEESSMEALGQEMESKLSVFFDDIAKSEADEDIYYKFKSGVISMKAGKGANGDSLWQQQKADPTTYLVKTKLVKDDILFLLKQYGHLGGQNWEFISSSAKYRYVLEGVDFYGDELVYRISFVPKRGGLFEGDMYISTTSFAVLQLEFAYAHGKQNERIQLLGVGHAMNFKEGKVIFEKGQGGYFVKYINARQHEMASIERDFTIMKKKKRALWDKELNEIKLEAKLTFDINDYWELLVLSRKQTDAGHFEAVQQPAVIKFKKEYAHTPDMWENRTVLAPASELKKFTRRD